MKVLFYGQPDLESGGGVANVAYYLPRALSKKIDVTYMLGIKSNDDLLSDYYGILTKFLAGKFQILHFNINPVWSNGSLMLLKFANLGRANTVLNIHGIPQLERNAEQRGESTRFIDWIRTKKVCEFASRVVVNSKFMRDNVLFWYGLPSDKVVVIPNGVDLKLFEDNTGKLELEGNPSILYVGHLSNLKGIDILIKAVARLKTELPNIKLHLVGNGYNPYFMSLAKQEGIGESVIFHEWARQSLISNYYKSADICVFPSRHEGFGIVILEAMAAGIPVIASDIPSFKELISHGVDGLLFKFQDDLDLSTKIAALYSNIQLRNQLIKNAQKKIESYAWARIADMYISLYQDIGLRS